MLYLVRKKDESVIINGNIEVKVIDIKGKSVKLGFEFPNTATVLRKEIHDRIVEENIAAAKQDQKGLEGLDIELNKLGSTAKKKEIDPDSVGNK